jgi:hypothetical protein
MKYPHRLKCDWDINLKCDITHMSVMMEEIECNEYISKYGVGVI